MCIPSPIVSTYFREELELVRCRSVQPIVHQRLKRSRMQRHDRGMPSVEFVGKLKAVNWRSSLRLRGKDTVGRFRAPSDQRASSAGKPVCATSIAIPPTFRSRSQNTGPLPSSRSDKHTENTTRAVAACWSANALVKKTVDNCASLERLVHESSMSRHMQGVCF